LRTAARARGVDRSLLRDDVYRRLRDAIVDGTFTPGEQLKDLELAAWLGVSRTPVREALLRLAQGGLVLAQPGRSTVVSPLDARDVRDARDVVAAMHEVAVREAVPLLTEADLAAMRDANRRFATAVGSGDVESAVRADDELHGVLVRIARNRALETVLEQFTPAVRRAERLRLTSPRSRESVTRRADLALRGR
jgi:DNA-binding GntR family transcriptional regulator